MSEHYSSDLTDEQWQTMIDVNLTGVWKTARAVSPALIEQKSGAIVFIGSVLSHRANKEFAHYTAANDDDIGPFSHSSAFLMVDTRDSLRPCLLVGSTGGRNESRLTIW